MKTYSGPGGRTTQNYPGPGFGYVIAHVHGASASQARPPAASHGATVAAASPIQPVAARIPVAPASTVAKAVPADIALKQAMTLEGVPDSWQPALNFIMQRESAGKVDARNPIHSARGLFQLTAANYHLNPNGAKSFGNAVEEAQGGIRYIKQRYGTADKAVAFWQDHHWY